MITRELKSVARLESYLEAQGIRVFFTETHTVEGGRPVGRPLVYDGLYGSRHPALFS